MTSVVPWGQGERVKRPVTGTGERARVSATVEMAIAVLPGLEERRREKRKGVRAGLERLDDL